MKIPSANPYVFAPRPGEYSPYPDMQFQQQRIADSKRGPDFARKLATMGVIGLGTAGLGSVLGGGGAAASGSSAGGGGYSSLFGGNGSFLGGAATTGGGTTAPVAASGLARLGSIFNSSGMNLGVNAGMSLLANRSQNKANDQARRDALQGQADALKVQREALEMEARNANLDREDARTLNAAINELKKRELAATEEHRAWERSTAEDNRSYDRGLVAQRETRLQPYRQISEKAINRLSSLWSL